MGCDVTTAAPAPGGLQMDLDAHPDVTADRAGPSMPASYGAACGPAGLPTVATVAYDRTVKLWRPDELDLSVGLGRDAGRGGGEAMECDGAGLG